MIQSTRKIPSSSPASRRLPAAIVACLRLSASMLESKIFTLAAPSEVASCRGLTVDAADGARGSGALLTACSNRKEFVEGADEDTTCSGEALHGRKVQRC
jgi:hypothetical protein